jgi:hypothetical protein
VVPLTVLVVLVLAAVAAVVDHLLLAAVVVVVPVFLGKVPMELLVPVEQLTLVVADLAVLVVLV